MLQMFNPSHPGEILLEYIKETGKTITEIAEGLGVSRKVISSIVNERAGISVEMAIKLAVAFNTSPEFWVNMQKNYDLFNARNKVDTANIVRYRKEKNSLAI